MATKKQMEKPSKKEELGGDSLRASLLKDDTFKKYRMIVKNLKEKMDLEELYEEVMRLHAGRTSRTLYGTTPGPEKIQNAALQDSSYRSRFTEIRVKVGKYADTLEIALDAVRIHLSTQYADSLPALKTKAERMGYFDGHLKVGLEFHRRMESLCKQVDLIIKDIDQNSYTIQHCIKVIELLYSRNNNKQ